MDKYTIGIHFTFEKASTILVNIANGEIIAVTEKEYSNGIITEYLPDGQTFIEPDWALQYPVDYLEVVQETIPQVLQQSGIFPESVISLGIAFTSGTLLPLDKNNQPLCLNPEFVDNPHSYVKLKPHDFSHPGLKQLIETLEASPEHAVMCGCKQSSHWLLPRIFQIYEEAKELFRATHLFMEAGDWIVYQLTGNNTSAITKKGMKSFLTAQKNQISKQQQLFFEEAKNKVPGGAFQPGTLAGRITRESSRLTGLEQGTSVCVANVDNYANLPATGIKANGTMNIHFSKATSLYFPGNKEVAIEGMCTNKENVVFSDSIGYEAHLGGLDEPLNWLEKISGKEMASLIPPSINENPGNSGLLALDWWNGNPAFSPAEDYSGIIIGFTPETDLEHVSQSVLEASAFGIKTFIERLSQQGLKTNKINITGAIPCKEKEILQLYANVLNQRIERFDSPYVSAIGAAIFAVYAALPEQKLSTHIKNMSLTPADKYSPKPESVNIYELVFAEYQKIYDYYQKNNQVMKKLKEIKNAI